MRTCRVILNWANKLQSLVPVTENGLSSDDQNRIMTYHLVKFVNEQHEVRDQQLTSLPLEKFQFPLDRARLPTHEVTQFDNVEFQRLNSLSLLSRNRNSDRRTLNTRNKSSFM